MDIYATAWIWATNSGEDNFPAFATLDGIPPNTNIYATTSVSSFSQAVDLQTGVAGTVGSVVRRWEIFNPDGSISQIEPEPDPANNSQLIENCASVTFELAVTNAVAWSQISLFTY